MNFVCCLSHANVSLEEIPWQAGLAGLTVEPARADSSRFTGPPEMGDAPPSQAQDRHLQRQNSKPARKEVKPNEAHQSATEATPVGARHEQKNYVSCDEKEGQEEPGIPQELESLSSEIEMDLREAIANFLSKPHTALHPQSKNKVSQY